MAQNMKPTNVLIYSIGVYQKTLSPDHGWLKKYYPAGYCKFTPSCSEYAKQAVERHGALRGSWLGLRRLGRCNPWNRGGVDEVPE